MNREIKISRLFEYPIKSCAGTELQQLEITERGLPNDRRWMVVDLDGNFITQREFGKMALIKPEIREDALMISAQNEASVLEVPLNYKGKIKDVEVWGSKLEGIDEGEIPAQWFSNYLGVDCRLVHMSPDFVREKKLGYGRFQFADSYPLLIVSEESLEDLNKRIVENGDQPVSINRFRPNIVTKGGFAYEEDVWSKIRVGELEIDVVKPCIRCPIPQIDQESGVKGKQPNKELYKYRRVSKTDVIFAQKAVSRNTGIIYLGSNVEIIEEKEAPSTL